MAGSPARAKGSCGPSEGHKRSQGRDYIVNSCCGAAYQQRVFTVLAGPIELTPTFNDGPGEPADHKPEYRGACPLHSTRLPVASHDSSASAADRSRGIGCAGIPRQPPAIVPLCCRQRPSNPAPTPGRAAAAPARTRPPICDIASPDITRQQAGPALWPAAAARSSGAGTTLYDHAAATCFTRRARDHEVSPASLWPGPGMMVR